MSYFLKR